MTDQIVGTCAGKVRGKIESTYDGTKFISFKGIPYAEPPVGDLRFRDPQPLQPWADVRETTTHASMCAHKDTMTKEIVGSDDCLYLNVYAKCMVPTQKWPVMVWIHGGGFVEGSGDEALYAPDYFMHKDVVLVTINYRVGVLGFLNLDDEVASGNQGLKDQVMSLKWVRDNIAYFGGDPNNVTIFGQSAGASSVHYLTMSPLAKGLFHKAILQSGVALNGWAYHSNIKEKTYRLCKLLGHSEKDSKSVVEFLRKIDVKKLIEAQEMILTDKERMKFEFPFGPSLDSFSTSPFMPINPENASKQGIDVPLMIGYNGREGSYFLKEISKYLKESSPSFDDNLLSSLGDTIESFQNTSPALIKFGFFDGDLMTKKSLEKLSDFIGNFHVDKGVKQIIKFQIQQKSIPPYVYQFTYDKDLAFTKAISRIRISGASHGDELAFLFKAQSLESFVELPKKGSDAYKLMKQMIEMWVNFATTGNPTPRFSALLPFIWQPAKDESSINYLNIGENLCMKVASNFEEYSI